MSMQFSVLASGSTGNSLIVKSKHKRLLIDVGLSAKKMCESLEQLGTRAEEIDAVLITHEHSDHIKGLGVFARKYGMPIYANAATWGKLQQMSTIGEIDERQRHVFATGDVLTFDDVQVQTFGISHDAAEPVGFCFHHEQRKMSVVTDLGYVSERIKETIRDSDILVMESNHDVNLLRSGHYPWNIKRRILGDLGHLSNVDAATAMYDVLSNRTKRVYLAHLSLQHNLQDLARMTVSQVLADKGIEMARGEVQLMDTYHDRPTKWDAV
jgi:phosphoribosyl 1,2-cyclic phosphodiesterase